MLIFNILYQSFVVFHRTSKVVWSVMTRNETLGFLDGFLVVFRDTNKLAESV